MVVDAFDHGSEVSISGRRNTPGRSTRNSGGVPDNFANYFVVEFDRDFDYVATADGKELHPDSLAWHAGEHAGARDRIPHKARRAGHGQSVLVVYKPGAGHCQSRRSGRSYDFDSVCAAGRDAGTMCWAASRSTREPTPDHRRTFYTCLYRSTLFPRKFYEFDAQGRPCHYSPYNGEVLPGYMYTDTGFWDTFRCPLPAAQSGLSSVNREIQEGLVLNAYRESGFYPEWASPGHRDCMVGNNSASVVADAYLKGVRVSNTATLWGDSWTEPIPSASVGALDGPLGYDYYNRLGCVPCDVGIRENAARTLEYAYDDWCIYRLGQGPRPPAGGGGALYARRARTTAMFSSHRHLSCAAVAPTDRSLVPFSPLKWGGELHRRGNSWHYTWSVFHDPDGLAALMGGPDRMDAMLDSVFAIPPLCDDSYYGFPASSTKSARWP